jgi:phage gp45-like
MSIVAALLETIRREIRPLMGMVEFVTDIAMDADGTATMKGAKSDDEEGHPIDAAVSWQLGFQSRPLDGASGVVVKAGGRGGVAFLVGWRNRRYELTLEKGETAMVNEAGAVVKLDKDGKITATAKTGQLVEVNGNDYSLLKTETLLGDLSTLMTHLIAWVPLVVTAVATAPVGAAVDPGVASTATAIKAAITADTYKSTKAKNG